MSCCCKPAIGAEAGALSAVKQLEEIFVLRSSIPTNRDYIGNSASRPAVVFLPPRSLGEVGNEGGSIFVIYYISVLSAVNVFVEFVAKFLKISIAAGDSTAIHQSLFTFFAFLQKFT